MPSAIPLSVQLTKQKHKLLPELQQKAYIAHQSKKLPLHSPHTVMDTIASISLFVSLACISWLVGFSLVRLIKCVAPYIYNRLFPIIDSEECILHSVRALPLQRYSIGVTVPQEVGGIYNTRKTFIVYSKRLGIVALDILTSQQIPVDIRDPLPPPCGTYLVTKRRLRRFTALRNRVLFYAYRLKLMSPKIVNKIPNGRPVVSVELDFVSKTNERRIQDQDKWKEQEALRKSRAYPGLYNDSTPIMYTHNITRPILYSLNTIDETHLSYRVATLGGRRVLICNHSAEHAEEVIMDHIAPDYGPLYWRCRKCKYVVHE